VWDIRTEEQVRALIDALPDGIVISRDTRVVFVNPEARRLFGASDESEIVGRSVFELFHDESRNALRDRLEGARCGQRVPAAEHTLLRPGGATLDAEVSSTGLADGAVALVVRDVTERKRTEAALRENERLTLAFAGAREGVWDWDLRTGAVVYSHRWKEMLGFAEDEIEPHVRAWEQLLHPDDRPLVEALH
jgi:PAS domain S-box-containing protein